MKSSGKWMLLACVLSLCSLTACATQAGTRSNARDALCHQTEAAIPDWPASDFEAYAIRLLAVIEADRTSWRIERDCVGRN